MPAFSGALQLIGSGVGTHDARARAMRHVGRGRTLTHKNPTIPPILGGPRAWAARCSPDLLQKQRLRPSEFV